jgi:hypothetical protein
MTHYTREAIHGCALKSSLALAIALPGPGMAEQPMAPADGLGRLEGLREAVEIGRRAARLMLG